MLVDKKEDQEDISKRAGPQPDANGIYESYTLNVQGMTANINIIDKGEFVPIYEVNMPGIGDATRILLMSIKPELLSLVPIDTSKVTNTEYMEKMREKYIEAANLIINKYLPTVHCVVGTEDMNVNEIYENIKEIVNSINRKLGGNHIKSLYVKFTMSEPLRFI